MLFRSKVNYIVTNILNWHLNGSRQEIQFKQAGEIPQGVKTVATQFDDLITDSVNPCKSLSSICNPSVFLMGDGRQRRQSRDAHVPVNLASAAIYEMRA